MFTARFDNANDFLDFLSNQGSYQRFHLKYPNGDPPESWSIYPVARSADGLWTAVLDYPLIEDVRWPEIGSTRISGWIT